jgi:hypothetical protein
MVSPFSCSLSARVILPVGRQLACEVDYVLRLEMGGAICFHGMDSDVSSLPGVCGPYMVQFL